MSDFWKKRVLILFSIAFFFVYLFLYIKPSVVNIPRIVFDNQTEPGFLVLNQPDETANYFFIRRLALNNAMSYREPLAEVSLNQVHPRSMTVIHENLAPIGFPGMILIYGIIIKFSLLFFSSDWLNIIAVSVTPLVGALTPLLFYILLKKVFTERIAFISSVLLYSLPPWWYYASRSFQNCTLYCFVLVLFLYLFMLWTEKENYNRKILCFALGLSWVAPVYIRGSEFIFIFILGAALFLTQWKKWNKSGLLFFAFGILSMIAVYFFSQHLYYGNIFASGYARPSADGSAGTLLSIKSAMPQITNLFLPFGFHPEIIAKNFYYYIFILFYPWPLLFLGGSSFVIILFVLSRKGVYDKRAGPVHLEDIFLSRKYAKAYLGLFCYFLAFLLIYYGSWSFADNLAGAVSIGSSQVRYFMPIYIFALPLAVIFGYEIWRLGRFGKVIAVFFTATLLIASWKMVYLPPLEGLKAVKSYVGEYYKWREKIAELTEPNSIITTKYADKYLFPIRKVVPSTTTEEEKKAVLNILKQNVPVYWYNMKMDQKSLETVATSLNLSGLQLSPPILGWENLELRRILLK